MCTDMVWIEFLNLFCHSFHFVNIVVALALAGAT